MKGVQISPIKRERLVKLGAAAIKGGHESFSFLETDSNVMFLVVCFDILVPDTISISIFMFLKKVTLICFNQTSASE